jgi:putative RNA 2'-phosphotransferase
MLVYILGHRPDEFGLVPAMDGFVDYKELLQAIHEEPEWRYVRQPHINEVLLSKDRSLFQADDKQIRVLDRIWRLDLEHPSETNSTLLFTPIRRKAHPVVMEKGLKSSEGKYIVLSPGKDMALRIGTRRDQRPVLLEVLAGRAESEGISFYSFGELFLCHDIPAAFISGPPISREDLEKRKKTEEKRETITPRPSGFAPGTFSLDISRDPDISRRLKAKRQKGWKEEARRMRRQKGR